MDMSQIKQLNDLKFRQSEQSMAKLLTRESALRSELERLQNMAHETYAQPSSQSELRAIGGDILWLQWLARARRCLNIELAQVLAQKETMMARHQQANGEKAVADALFEKHIITTKRNREKRALDHTIETALTRSAFSNPDGQYQ
ncbi:MAG: hypothetical protein AAFQ58_07870 [Pseudomonadota bacterium]